MRKKRPFKLRQASAYYRLAAKATRNGQFAQAEHFRRIADMFVKENQRENEARKRRRQ